MPHVPRVSRPRPRITGALEPRQRIAHGHADVEALPGRTAMALAPPVDVPAPSDRAHRNRRARSGSPRDTTPSMCRRSTGPAAGGTARHRPCRSAARTCRAVGTPRWCRPHRPRQGRPARRGNGQHGSRGGPARMRSGEHAEGDPVLSWVVGLR